MLQNLKTSMDADSIITSMERMIKDNNLFTDNAKVNNTKTKCLCFGVVRVI